MNPEDEEDELRIPGYYAIVENGVFVSSDIGGESWEQQDFWPPPKKPTVPLEQSGGGVYAGPMQAPPAQITDLLERAMAQASGWDTMIKGVTSGSS